jgi:soluble lytic murein transglycosylase
MLIFLRRMGFHVTSRAMVRTFVQRFAIALALAAPIVLAAAPREKGPAPSGQLTPDEHFLAARDAFVQGNAAKFASHAAGLRGHVLQAYIEYWELRLRLAEAEPGEVSDFLGRYGGSLVAEQLRREWLLLLGKRGEWELFDAAFTNLVNDDVETGCYRWLSRWRRGDYSVATEFRRLWMTPRDLPDGCVSIAQSEIATGRLATHDIWNRVRLLLEAGQITTAKRAINYLPAGETPDERTLNAIYNKPARFLERAEKLDLRKRVNRELVLFALTRLARSEADAAASHWTRKLQAPFSAEDRAWAWAHIATHAARQHLPEALEWFAQADSLPLKDEQLEWRARAALREGRWDAVQTAIERMSPTHRNEPTWIYWHARAIAAAGDKEAADALFARIAGEHHFYGKLALEALLRPLEIPPRDYAPTPEEVAAASRRLMAALALFRLDLRSEAVQEWNWTIRGMDDRQLLAAAEAARQNELWDRAINTANRTQRVHDFDLRYLAPYRNVFEEQARAQGLEEHYVLGLVRQESRFIQNARSPVGASGLMQLMPKTAKWTAKRIGLSNFSAAQVEEVHVNIALGTGYLRYVLEELDGNPVLAAAAYNAGPGRARKWKGERPLEGAIYAETIPFNETRDYVKKVMSNTLYYAALGGGDPRSLKARLGIIPPRRGGEGYAATVTGEATIE